MPEDTPPIKGIRPIANTDMYNFVYWIFNYHPEIKSLQNLPSTLLNHLVRQFEQDRPDIEPHQNWEYSLEQLHNPTGCAEYDELRLLLDEYHQGA